MLLSVPAFAQQKTVKACTQEWQANKDANQAKGVTLKAYVTQCRAGGAAQTQTAPSAAAGSGASRGAENDGGRACGDRPEDRQGLYRRMAREQGRQ